MKTANERKLDMARAALVRTRSELLAATDDESWDYLCGRVAFWEERIAALEAAVSAERAA